VIAYAMTNHEDESAETVKKTAMQYRVIAITLIFKIVMFWVG